MTTFAQLGLPDALVRSLKERDIVEPFPVQTATIPDALDGRDVCGKAPTGSGKTLAFGLPVLANIDKASRNRPRALMLAPTRELAEQIKQELFPLARAMKRFVFAIYGGVGYGPQRNAMRKGVDVLVATPGRLEDMIDQGAVDLQDVQFVVVDEADRMADMGFMPAVKRILDQTDPDRQTLLFSATLDGDIAVLSRDYQHDPVRHEAGSIEPETIDARHHFWLVGREERIQHTADVVDSSGRSIVFTRTRHGADRLAKQLSKLGVGAVAMHGGRTQNQRQRALQAFASGRAQALVATDVAARGIHIDAVASVVHFDPPADHKDYLHRSGRTARAGATGTVVSMVTGDQKRTVSRMQRDLNLRAPIGEPRMEDLEDGGHRIDDAPGNDRRPESRTARPAKRSDRPRRSERSGRSERSERHDRGDRRSERNDRQERGDQRGERQDRSDRSERAPVASNGRGAESLYVANLPWNASESDVASLFGRFGEVSKATIIMDRRTGRSKGFGFVDMPKGDARKALDSLNGSKMGGRELTVRTAKPSRYQD